MTSEICRAADGGGGDAPTESDAEAEPLGPAPSADDVCDGVDDHDRVTVGVTAAVVDAVTGEGDTVVDADTLVDRENEVDALTDDELVALPLPEDELEDEPVADIDGDDDAAVEPEGLGDTEAEPPRLADAEPLALPDGEREPDCKLAEADAAREREPDALTLPLPDVDGVELAVDVADGVSVGVADELGVALDDPDVLAP